MVSAAASRNVVKKPFFVNPALTKVTGAYYKNHLKSKCYQLAENCTLPTTSTTSIMEHSHTSVKHTVQLLERGSRMSLSYQGPTATLLKSALLFLFQVKRKVHEGKLTPFKNLDKLKRKFTSVWWSCSDLLTIWRAIQQLGGRSEVVVEACGLPIKLIF